MFFFSLIWADSNPRLIKLAILSAISGLANALVMICVSLSIAKGRSDASHLTLFTFSVMLYFISERAVVSGSATELELLNLRIRKELLDLVRAANPASLLQNNPAEIYSAITQDTQIIVQAAQGLPWFAQAASVLMCTGLYLLWISPVEFATLLFLCGLALAVAVSRSRNDHLSRTRATEAEDGLQQSIVELLDGFKEAKASPRTAAAQLEAITLSSQFAATSDLTMKIKHILSAVSAQTVTYAVLAILLFALPILHPVSSLIQRQTATALLFSVGSIGFLIQILPLIFAANHAAERLRKLTDVLPRDVTQMSIPPIDKPSAIALKGASYTWRSPDGVAVFQVGPIDLRSASGEIIFIVGGNGSGKSTLLHLLAGIILPEGGKLVCDEIIVCDGNVQSYRDQVSSIFSDNHLFRFPYGRAREPAAAALLLQDYGLAEQVHLLPDGSWSTVALSRGQRKKLALIDLLLNPTDIIILDEWAADQDPISRERFYYKTLPEFRQAGRVIVCATHDDRFFSVADRRYIMKDGRLIADDRGIEELGWS